MKLLKPAILALICGLPLAVLNHRTQGVIEDNRSYHEQQQLRRLVADVTGTPELVETETGYTVSEGGKPVARIARGETGQGYNGRIKLLVAHQPTGEVISVRVTQHEETPGIGDKIDTDISDWITGFQGRTRANTNWQLAPGGDIDGITGATITSRAVSNAVREALPE